MRRVVVICLLVTFVLPTAVRAHTRFQTDKSGNAEVILRSPLLDPRGAGGDRSLKLDGLFYETNKGRTNLPAQLTATVRTSIRVARQAKMPDGRKIGRAHV